MRKQDVAILTFHWTDNYGALLQCYALQRFINKLECNCFVIDYVPPQIRRDIRLLHLQPSYLIKDIVFFYRNFLRRLTSNRFRKKFISFSSAEKSFDILVVGSDQVWNLPMTYGDAIYFGIGIHNKNAAVLSYAASMGQNLPEKWKDKFFEYFKNVSKVSVREETAKKYISTGSDVPVTVVLDPVFLVSKSEWGSIIPDTKPVQKPYIFVYTVDGANVEFVKAVDAISEHLNVDVICPGKSVYKHRNYKRIVKTYGLKGPEVFLSYLMNASFVVTSSFHGLAFSLLFEKQFVAVSPSSNASRLHDLLDRINCSHRIVHRASEVSEKLLSTKIDYTIVSEKLEKEKSKSAHWLNMALSNEN